MPASSITFDQWIQIANAVGTWVAGFGTLAAVGISLWLVLDARRVRLKVRVGVYELIRGDGTSRMQFVNFDVTNLADRPITISAVGWVIGKGKGRRFASGCLRHAGRRAHSTRPRAEGELRY
ncbi:MULTISPECIES: hypothetical protein [unclassified Variovorax]|uniref:hypothetical protein n=1 Tax=unclassified Variovorax TaxID=663243 RepID=UPI00076C2D05|nr:MULTISPECIES: hypothetical protein [unclassified Variovorax]KWT73953.1 hypothetical protein APY03_5804 [Variovorax sp. WDL1]PNG52289.1 hypothetical protein CHC07_04661 [Variovorax sp. B4]PNG54829.1 hypothetical protein CHC06_03627 [Variovorax sp. B2]VTV15837.1 hypothetical protein WDL1CHR_06201 [Variovorax sp. WDL1]